MYDIEPSESFFPAQAGEPQHLMTIGQMLSRSADNHPNQPALKELLADGSIGRVWSYSELLHDAERLARALSTRHAEGARVTVYAVNIPEWLLLQFGCALAGITLVTANPAYQAGELKYVVEQSGSEAIYFVDSYRGNPMGEFVGEVGDVLRLQRKSGSHCCRNRHRWLAAHR